jgi:LysR family hydrogen peroxide-inducible transcriptional activator
MEVCHMKERQNQGEMSDLRASSLETLIQLVKADFGITLVPALAMGGTWTSGSGVVAQPLKIADASRRISLVYRQSYPRRSALKAFADTLLDNLPNTVQLVGNRKKAKEKTAKKKQA